MSEYAKPVVKTDEPVKAVADYATIDDCQEFLRKLSGIVIAHISGNEYIIDGTIDVPDWLMDFWGDSDLRKD